jgi:hypothetical protein
MNFWLELVRISKVLWWPIMSIDELVKAANDLNETDLDQLVSRVLLLKAKRQAPVLSGVETKLLMHINQGIPADLQQQYRDLRIKRDDGTLTDAEYELLLELSDRIEILAAERAGSLVKLAELRQVPLTQLMNDLGIKAPSYV